MVLHSLRANFKRWPAKGLFTLPGCLFGIFSALMACRELTEVRCTAVGSMGRKKRLPAFSNRRDEEFNRWLFQESEHSEHYKPVCLQLMCAAKPIGLASRDGGSRRIPEAGRP